MISKGFFRIDRRTWAVVCGLGMNPAVAYLVLACGTGRDNRTSSWSAQAVAEYGGIAWVRGKPAIQKLCEAGLVVQTKTGARPRYELQEWIEVEQTKVARRPKLNPYELIVYGDIEQGKQPRNKADKKIADDLVRQRWLWFCGSKYVLQPPTDGAPSEHYIWLPQTLVMGTPAGEDPPVVRLRRSGDVLALRLFVDLYHAQHLRDDGGISRTVVYQKFHRERVGEQGIYVVWSFSLAQQCARYHPITAPHWGESADGQTEFWKRLEQLQGLGLIEFIPHLCECSGSDAELIHPYGIDWSQNGMRSLENAVGYAAHSAGMMMRKQGGSSKCQEYLAPVPRDYTNVQMVGIVRLRYRPHTKRTSEWWAILQTRLPKLIEGYNTLRDKAEASRVGIKGHQGASMDVKISLTEQSQTS